MPLVLSSSSQDCVLVAFQVSVPLPVLVMEIASAAGLLPPATALKLSDPKLPKVGPCVTVNVTATVAGESAAHAWDLTIVSTGIQDDPHNRTRFLAIGEIEPLPTGNDKTSLILAVPNRAGAVYEMLAPLAQNGVSMTRLESRPARTGQWDYYFYVDVLGHRNDANVAAALQILQTQVAFLKVLGSYPAQ